MWKHPKPLTARLRVAGVVAALMAVAIPVLVTAEPAVGTFPGANGQIAYGVDSLFEIYAMDADGSNQTNLTNDPARDATPMWSPDGRRIAFNRDSDVYVMDADGSDPVNLTGTPLSGEGPGSWSPDGSKILFTSDRDGNTEIYVMDADGGNQTRLTNDPATEYEATWSPDGTKIAYTEYRDGNGEIYVMDADGTDLVNLTNDPAEDGSPDWSPDGSKIAFNSHRDSPTVMELYVMDADGSNPTNLSNTPDEVEQWPAWSPDGTKIAYSGSGPGGNDIYVMDADGGNPTDLTNTEDANEQAADWQPLPLDATPPAIALTTPAEAATYTLGAVVSADYTCTDENGGSGLASCTGTVPDGSLVDTGWVGAKTFTVTATDGAGNEASLTHAFTVVYDFSGFFSPVDNLPIVNVVNAGRAVPVKFGLAGDQGLGILANGFPLSQRVTCDGSAPFDGIEETVTAGSSSLSYDATTRTYTYVWKTDRAWAGSCRQLVLRLVDGTTHRAGFSFR